jgi:DNA-binding LytR/AlgR family response regulator
MSGFKIMIVEDDELVASKMEMQIDKLGYELFAAVDNSESAIEALQESQPDLILMDINIEGEYDGIELTDMIHQQWEIPVIFVSSLQDDYTFRRLRRTNPVGFILKPFSDIQLKRTIELVLEKIKTPAENSYEVSTPAANQKSDYIFIKKKNQLEKVKISEIFYIEADGKYAQIYMIDRKYLIRMSLREVIKRLDSSRFIQTHRSFIVNMDKIKSIDLQDYMIVLDNMHIPISRREREVVLDRLDTFV